MMFVLSISLIFAQPAKEIETARKAGKSVFLLVTDHAAKGTDVLKKVAENAVKSAKNTIVVQLNRDEPGNKSLVSKYRIAGASLPMILVLATNGTVAGSMPAARATAESLLTYLPSKTQEQVLLGFENGKAALIVCAKKNARDTDNLVAECTKAVAALGNKAIQVMLYVDDKNEKNFVDLIKPELAKTSLLVFNGKGQYTGVLGLTAKSKDISSLVNKKAGGCCPETNGNCGKK